MTFIVGIAQQTMPTAHKHMVESSSSVYIEP